MNNSAAYLPGRLLMNFMSANDHYYTFQMEASLFMQSVTDIQQKTVYILLPFDKPQNAGDI